MRLRYGISKVIGGTAWTATIIVLITFFPGKSNLEKEYAAKRPITKVNTTTQAVTKYEFKKNLISVGFWKIFAYASKLNDFENQIGGFAKISAFGLNELSIIQKIGNPAQIVPIIKIINTIILPDTFFRPTIPYSSAIWRFT